MLNFLSTLPGIVIGFGAVAGFIVICVIGGLYVAGLLKGKKDEENALLVSTLKETVDALKDRMDTKDDEWKEKEQHWQERDEELTEAIDGLTAEIGELKKENERFVEIFQGRDKKTQEFYEKAFVAMEVNKGTHELVVQLGKQQTELIPMMKTLMEKMATGTTIINQSPKQH